VKKNYRPWPVDQSDPTTTQGESYVYWPVLQVRVGRGHAQSPRFDAVVDSGSPWCLFKADIGRMVDIDIEKGPKYPLGGVVANVTLPAYVHKVKIYVEAIGVIECMAGFCDNLGVTGILF